MLNSIIVRICAVRVNRETGRRQSVWITGIGLWSTLGETQIVNCTCYSDTVVAFHRLMQCVNLVSLEKDLRRAFVTLTCHLHWSGLEASVSEPACGSEQKWGFPRVTMGKPGCQYTGLSSRTHFILRTCQALLYSLYDFFRIFTGFPIHSPISGCLSPMHTFPLLLRTDVCWRSTNPKRQNPHLSGTFISWGEKKKTFFSFFVDLGQMSFLPWQKWNEW